MIQNECMSYFFKYESDLIGLHCDYTSFYQFFSCAMHTTDSCSDMCLGTSPCSLIPTLPTLVRPQPFDGHQHSIFVRMQEVCETIPVFVPMLGVGHSVGCHSMPCRFQFAGGPEFHHIPDVHKSHFVEDRRVGPHLVRG